MQDDIVARLARALQIELAAVEAARISAACEIQKLAKSAPLLAKT